MSEYRIESVGFDDQRAVIYGIRHAVFVVEQHVPEEIEIDELDADALHLLVWVGTQAVGTARMTRDGRIGRMAVVKNWRGRGVGRAMLENLIRIGVNRGLPRLILSAQIHAVPFYAAMGFQTDGKIYEEAGIDHIGMVLESRKPQPAS